MWRSKKFVLIAVLAAVVLAGSIGGAVLANDINVDDSQPKPRHEALLDRVSEIYQENTGVAIDTQQLKDAFTQAQSEMQNEALQSRLQYLVEQGNITQQQADQHKAWLESRPDMPFKFGFSGRGGHRAWGGHDGWGGYCAPKTN